MNDGMNDAALTPDRILDAAEEVLRRYGPQKTTVVDVARALDVSHGTIYRHYPSKQALRDAVTRRWLQRVTGPLQTIAEERGPAAARLRRWFDALIAFKRRKLLDEPELFATYHAIAEDAREVIREHVGELVGQIARIIRDGVAEWVDVKRGASMNHQGVDLVEIFGDLEPGDQVAVRGTDELRAGTKANVKQSSPAK